VDFPVPDGPEITIGFSAVDIVAMAWGMDLGRIITRREGVRLMVEGMGWDGLRKRVKRARVIRSLSPNGVGLLVFEGPGQDIFFGSPFWWTSRVLMVRLTMAAGI